MLRKANPLVSKYQVYGGNCPEDHNAAGPLTSIGSTNLVQIVLKIFDK